MVRTITETQHILADMLTENTGRALCDSGDAYGRNWERNQGLTVEALLDAPEASFDGDKDGQCYGFTVDVFHYLDARLEFAPEVDAEFQAFANLPENEYVGWLALMEDWADQRNDKWATFNSYNDWTSLLSQVIQGTCVELGDQWYVLLQIHGGCDVRGGYTRPRVFRIDDAAGYGEYFSLIAGQGSVYIWAGKDRWDCRDGEWINPDDGSYQDDGPDLEHFKRNAEGQWIYAPTGAEAEITADNEW